ncbi:septal ring lytic transglycosylase RlpA family protein [Segnochrobactrum spirostomi]|uniref:septal ring lytic transglycosylase RlpA family protein n=1 Tax=Segnochrobactrum spirostomi TaxID=2608987 RepID=UPI0028A9A6F4|nr:septal ring lytic transglycosylase RlpA family protein [Segnochrobactrum spirostomi]
MARATREHGLNQLSTESPAAAVDQPSLHVSPEDCPPDAATASPVPARSRTFKAAMIGGSLVAGCLAVSGCMDKSDQVASVPKPSPRAVASTDGSDGYKIGKPYKVRGKWYKPGVNSKYKAIGLASWYGSGFHGRRTASGEKFDTGSLTVAHPTLPMPSYVRVTNLENGRSIVARVNDRGPFSPDRVVDVSSRVASLLDFKRSGTAEVKVEYVGLAPLQGDDTRTLLSTLSTPEKPEPPSTQAQTVMVASAGAVAAAAQPALQGTAGTATIAGEAPQTSALPGVSSSAPAPGGAASVAGTAPAGVAAEGGMPLPEPRPGAVDGVSTVGALAYGSAATQDPNAESVIDAGSTIPLPPVDPTRAPPAPLAGTEGAATQQVASAEIAAPQAAAVAQVAAAPRATAPMPVAYQFAESRGGIIRPGVAAARLAEAAPKQTANVQVASITPAAPVATATTTMAPAVAAPAVASAPEAEPAAGSVPVPQPSPLTAAVPVEMAPVATLPVAAASLSSEPGLRLPEPRPVANGAPTALVPTALKSAKAAPLPLPEPAAAAATGAQPLPSLVPLPVPSPVSSSAMNELPTQSARSFAALDQNAVVAAAERYAATTAGWRASADAQ